VCALQRQVQQFDLIRTDSASGLWWCSWKLLIGNIIGNPMRSVKLFFERE
jgi:hypothetical protein